MMFEEFTLEFKSFCKMFYYFTVSMQVMNQLNGTISVFDVLSQYRIKTLKNEDINKLLDVKLYDFKVFKGLNTDLVFVTFKIRPLDLNRVKTVFNPIDRSFRKYKVEFTKSERSLLFKLKNNSSYEYNHRDCISESMQLNLNGNYELLPLEETFENIKQVFESEYEFKRRIKKQKWEKIKKQQILKSNAIKALRLWTKLQMPQLPKTKKKKTVKFDPENLKKEKGWRNGQKRESVGLLYVDAYGNLDKNLTVAPIKVPQKFKPSETVFISTEKIDEQQKRALW